MERVHWSFRAKRGTFSGEQLINDFVSSGAEIVEVDRGGRAIWIMTKKCADDLVASGLISPHGIWEYFGLREMLTGRLELCSGPMRESEIRALGRGESDERLSEALYARLEAWRAERPRTTVQGFAPSKGGEE